MSGTALVLDAMGVIYTAADDVAELLVPYVMEHGGSRDAEEISTQYLRASLGEFASSKFWPLVGLPASVEDDYLARHRLTTGLLTLLTGLPTSVDSVWCLSNDVAEWSLKLRQRHQLTPYFSGFVISGDVRVRKPDVGIYQALLAESALTAESHVFVDDRLKNLDAARKLGMRTVHFTPNGDQQQDSGSHARVKSFSELKDWLTT